MHYHLLLRASLLALAFLVPCHFARATAQENKPAPSGEAIAAKAEEYLQAQLKANGFSGSVLVARGDQVLVAKGCGLANAEHDVPNSPNTKFRLGSITKQFTAMAILILQEQGKLSVDDLVSKHAEGCPESWKEITIHQLLTHTSGIPSFTGLPGYRTSMPLPSSPAKTLDRVREMPLEFTPGEKFAYSNSGYVLLGQVIEQVSGKSYEDFLQASIFEQLGMKNTGYDLPGKILPHRATGYEPAKGGLANASYLDMTIPHAAGSLYSTVEDLHRWSRALDAGKLIPKVAYEKMLTPGKGNYGYGWIIAKEHGREHVGHGGGINGFTTSISRYPGEKLCVVVLCNVVTSNPGEVSRDLAAIALGEPYELPQERKFVAVEAKILDKYVGKYEIAPNLVLTISREGERLLGQPTGQSQVELRPLSDAKFLAKEVNGEITFMMDDEGHVTHLVLRQGRRETQAKRLQ